MSLVDEMLARVAGMDEEAKQAALETIEQAVGDLKWIPTPGPQYDAYHSEAFITLYGGEAGGGKALSVLTPLPTPHGWTTMGEVQVGDALLDELGNSCLVVAKSPVFREDTFRVVFSDGEEIVAGERHQWVTRNYRERNRIRACSPEARKKRRAKRANRGTGKRPDLALRNSREAKSQNLPTSGIRTTREIYDSITASNHINHSIDVCGALDLTDVDLLIDPYVLGAWLGDGSTTSGQITNVDEEIWEMVGNSYPIKFRPKGITHTCRGMKGQLRQIGVLGNKHIPITYLRASFDQRLALLQGLMDTDGYCDPRGQCEFTSIKKKLAEDVRELILSLGIKVSVSEGEAKLNGKVISANYRLKFLTEHEAFRLPRKLIRQKRGNFRGTHNRRYIVDVIPTEHVDLQCVEVDSPNHMYLCGRGMIPTHNSGLLTGLALTAHRKSLIMRRQYTDLDAIIEDTLKQNGSRAGFSGKPPATLRTKDKRIIQFSAAKNLGDEEAQQGQPKDFLGIDEASQFAESQVRFLMGWVRTTDKNQRCRVVFATNPPHRPGEGEWLKEMFAPWLNPLHPNPAKPGELRWYVSDVEGRDMEVESSEPFELDGRMVQPLSRTFIRARVTDNPFLGAEYEANLDSLPEPLRSAVRDGNWMIAHQDDENQVIPSAWVAAAQERWTPEPPQHAPMCSMGVDVARGGNDSTVLAPRYDGYFAKLIQIPGRDTPLGTDVAGHVVKHRRHNAICVIDMGGGYGGAPYEHLKANIDGGVETDDRMVVGYDGSKSTSARTIDGQLGFFNKRAESYWRLREALDPGQEMGSPISLPPDPELMAELCAISWELTPRGIKLQDKKKVTEFLGRSPDKADAVVMAFSKGARLETHGSIWRESAKNHRKPKVNRGYENRKRRR